jgi:hypothetical protein
MILETIGLALACLLFFLPGTSKPDTLRGLSDGERRDRYRNRLDIEIGLDSEEQLAREARGRIAKERLLAGIRREIPAHHALIPTDQPARVRYTGPMPRGRRNIRELPLPLHRAHRRARSA